MRTARGPGGEPYLCASDEAMGDELRGWRNAVPNQRETG